MINIKDLHIYYSPIVGLRNHTLSELNPLPSEDQQEALRIDILNKGQMVPIVMYRGMIVDGRSRVKAINDIAKKDGTCKNIKFLGGKVSCIDLPRNMKLNLVEELVRSLEVRRMQSKTQLATQAYLIKKNGSSFTNEELANIKGVASSLVNRCKRIHTVLGEQEFNKLVNGSEITLTTKSGNVSKTSNLNVIYKIIGEKEKEEIKRSHEYLLSEYQAGQYSRHLLGKYCRSKSDAIILLKAIQNDVINMLED